LNNRGIENVCLEDEKWHDINNITSLLKLFLRKLPEGLVTAGNNTVFLCNRIRSIKVEALFSGKICGYLVIQGIVVKW